MPLIQPRPPTAQEELPHIGTGLRFLDSPTDYLAGLREQLGDSFFVDVFGFPLFVTFAPKGLESLYALEESAASFGLATFDLIGFKTPSEIFDDADTRLFYQLLMNRRMPAYVQTMDTLVQRELARWGDSGELNLFDAIRTLEQRVGYGLWIAPEAAEDHRWSALKQQFDVIDQESAFVSPQAILETIKTGKAKERAAVAALKTLITDIIAEHDANSNKTYATVDFLREHFQASSDDVRLRQVLHSVINTNQGFLSNLYAAIAWVITRLLEFPEVLAKVDAELHTARVQYGDALFTSTEALNSLVYLEQVMMESVRLAQRSITLRKVLQPLTFDVGDVQYAIEPGVYITTMLSVTNTQSDALRQFNPDFYQQNQAKPALQVHGKESVSTFGHGKHACPAQRFSHHMCKIAVGRLLERFHLSADITNPQPARAQLGGVARPEQPILVHFHRRRP